MIAVKARTISTKKIIIKIFRNGFFDEELRIDVFTKEADGACCCGGGGWFTGCCWMIGWDWFCNGSMLPVFQKRRQKSMERQSHWRKNPHYSWKILCEIEIHKINITQKYQWEKK